MRQLRTRALAFGVFALLIGAEGAWAQSRSDVTPLSEAQSLACLKRPDDKPVFPPRPKPDGSSRWVRLLLRFSSPSEAPALEILANTLQEDQLKVVRRYVEGYRLPCLQASDGSVQAVQEFNFNNSELAPLPMPPDRPHNPSACIIQPTYGVSLSGGGDPREIEHVVLTMAFTAKGPSGPGTPDIKVLYTDASPETVRDVTEWAAQSRMPCLTVESEGTRGPVVLRQSFSIRPYGHRGYTFTNARLSLAQFLGMADDLDTLKADFDLDSMGCPFNVNYTIYGPRLPNEVEAGQPVNPNRLAFLQWMAARELRFKSAKMANDLFGETVQIEVPCGKLRLGDETTTGSSL